MKCLAVLCLIVLTVWYKEVSALLCYECNPCNDPFDKKAFEKNTTECDGACLKTITEFHDLGLYISRKCSDTVAKEECKSDRGNNEVCICNSKLCNASPRTTIISIAMLSLPVILTLVFVL